MEVGAGVSAVCSLGLQAIAVLKENVKDRRKLGEMPRFLLILVFLVTHASTVHPSTSTLILSIKCIKSLLYPRPYVSAEGFVGWTKYPWRWFLGEADVEFGNCRMGYADGGISWHHASLSSFSSLLGDRSLGFSTSSLAESPFPATFRATDHLFS